MAALSQLRAVKFIRSCCLVVGDEELLRRDVSKTHTASNKTHSPEPTIEMISFHDDAVSNVVDKWLDLEDLNSGPDANEVALSAAATAGNQRLGLGYQPAKGSKATDKLAVLKKEKKRKQDAEDYGTELHGMVEEDLEESRTKVQSSSRAQVKAQQPAAKKIKIEPTVSKPVPQSQAAPQSSEKKPAAPSGGLSHFEQSPNLSTISGITDKPKRTKTRSKQKNIRRDNRPDSAKPDYLQMGAKDYKGRPLTPETKAILHLPPKDKSKARQNKHGKMDFTTGRPPREEAQQQRGGQHGGQQQAEDGSKGKAGKDMMQIDDNSK